MGQPATRLAITAADYLAAEREAEIKHEFFDGEVFAMSGASRHHSSLALNLAVELRAQKRSGCELHVGDVKVAVDASNAFFYPDVVLSCDEPKGGDAYYLVAPSLVAEVLSPSTEAFDRGLKWETYKQILSLKVYLLIAQDRISVHAIQIDDQDRWVYRTYGEGDTLELESLGMRIPVATIYEGVELPEPPPLPVDR